MIFQRSLVRELVNTASAIFIALLTIVLTIGLVRILGQAAAGQVDNSAVLALISFAALNNLPVLLQLTVFVTILLTMTRSYRDSEMVVWQSSGLGLDRWLRPVLTFTIPVAIVVGIGSLFVAPWANRQASEFKARFEQRTEVSRVAPGQFRESSDGTKVFFVEGFDPTTSSVQNVLVNTIRDGKVSVIVSKTGRVEVQPNGDEFLIMNNGRRYEGTPGKPDYRIMEFERYGVRIESKTPDFSNDDSAKIPFDGRPRRGSVGAREGRAGLALRADAVGDRARGARGAAVVRQRAGRSIRQPDRRVAGVLRLQQRDEHRAELDQSRAPELRPLLVDRARAGDRVRDRDAGLAQSRAAVAAVPAARGALATPDRRCGGRMIADLRVATGERTAR